MDDTWDPSNSWLCWFCHLAVWGASLTNTAEWSLPFLPPARIPSQMWTYQHLEHPQLNEPLFSGLRICEFTRLNGNTFENSIEFNGAIIYDPSDWDLVSFNIYTLPIALTEPYSNTTMAPSLFLQYLAMWSPPVWDGYHEDIQRHASSSFYTKFFKLCRLAYTLEIMYN